jgi:hypothetical protein
MNGPWKDEEELRECMLYWQKRALEAEIEVEEVLDYNEELVELVLEARGNAEYYKQQFLDKDKEMRIMIKRVVSRAADIGTEESDDPWKYRS